MNELKDYQSILAEKAERVENFFGKYPEDCAELEKTFAEINAEKIRKVEPEIITFYFNSSSKNNPEKI